MKKFLFSLLITIALFSCKKEVTTQEVAHEKSYYDVLAIGQDTLQSSAMLARTETVGLVTVEDTRLKAVLTAYHKDTNGNGVYTIELTNKQSGEVVVSWNWSGLTIDNISPANNTLSANQTKTFTLTGSADVGKIKVKAFGDCGNSTELIINITMSVLPFKYLANTAEYDEETGRVIISFAIDNPGEVDWIIIRNHIDGEWKQVLLLGCDHVTQSYSIPL